MRHDTQRHLATLLSLLLTGAVAIGCGGDDATTISVSFAASSPGSLTLDDGLEVDRLQMQLREIKILPDSDNGEGDKFKVKDTFVMDLLAPEGSVMPDMELAAGTYKKVEYKVDKPKDGGGLDGTDASMWFEGSFEGVAFRYLDERMDKITLRAVDGVTLGDGDHGELVVALNVQSWLAGVDMASLVLDDADVAVIEDKGDNKDAHGTIEDAIKAAIKVARKP